MLKDIRNPQYWNQLWQQNLGKHMGGDPVEHWNKKAKSFTKMVESGEGNKRINGVINFLKKQNVLWDNMKILDIGCGPGNFALPFAQLGAQVTAMDPAPNMLEALKEQIATKNIKNIEVVQGLWEELDIREMGWYKKFDLVFASQSPGLRDMETIEKMNDCSSQYCFATGFDGKRQMSLYDAFFQKYFDRPYIKNSHDIIFLINLLYSSGHRPTVEFLNLSRTEKYPVEEIKKSLKEISVSEELQLEDFDEEIERFLAAQAQSEAGSYGQSIRQVIGMVLWKPEIF
ncbi:MAG: hypothetical protein VR72_19625 [Clostridiaceae bacterium BRH_c20a]|nr:MAG: hypothetical protein VR72_19625 [Clostridiaceae bacterium BRH_c20a]